MAEVDQVTDWLAGDAHVVEELRLMLRRQLRHCLEFHHQTAEHDQVGDVALLELPAFLKALEFGFREESDAAQAQLNLKTLLVNFLCHPVTLFRYRPRTRLP
jgi:hypothetical protein